MHYTGLNDKEVIQNRNKYGTNSLTKQNKDTFLSLFLESLNDPIIKILILALFIKLIFLFKDTNYFETLGIIIAILISSLISSLSEYGNSLSFTKMEQEANMIFVKVYRNNKLSLILIDEIVKDDIILLESADKVPTDGIILWGNVKVDESSLTGETKERERKEKDNLYRGTVIYSGKCIMKTTEVGDNTYYGKIFKEVNEPKSDSPLKIRLRDLSKTISKIGYVCAFLVSFSYLFKVILLDNNFDINRIMNTLTNFKLITNYLIYALTLSVTVLVVAVPEGLPMMVALVLSSNMKKLLKKNVLVRKLVGIETSGSLNILFTDKTGTLTEGKLKVNNIILGDGTILNNPKKHKIYNNIKENILYNTQSIITDKGIIGGNITDKCLTEYINESIYEKEIIKEELFSSITKYSSVTLKNGITYYKGAKEVLFDKCIFYLDENGNKKLINKNIISIINEYELNGERVICLCESNDSDKLTLTAFVTIKDNIRKNVIESIKKVKDAKVDVVMITGDNKDTASSIAKSVGILSNKDDIVLTSEELNKLTDEEVKKIIPKLKVVARLLPQDKLRLIKLSKELNLVVGMTGDGMNDAPALKASDVGFALSSGSDVSKEAADIILLDNNFESITYSILYGRTIFKSIRKFIIFQLTVNMCAVLLSLIGPFIGNYTPVTVIQMLWINMIMDTLAGLAYAYEPALEEYMKEPPKKKEEKIINKYMINQILTSGLYIFIVSILFLKLDIFRNLYRVDETDKYILTAFFGLFIFFTIFNSFNARTYRLNLLSHIKENKVFILIIVFIFLTELLLIYFGGTLFRCTGLTLIELNFTILLSLTIIPFDLSRKIILRLTHHKGSI